MELYGSRSMKRWCRMLTQSQICWQNALWAFDRKGKGNHLSTAASQPSLLSMASVSRIPLWWHWQKSTSSQCRSLQMYPAMCKSRASPACKWLLGGTLSNSREMNSFLKLWKYSAQVENFWRHAAGFLIYSTIKNVNMRFCQTHISFKYQLHL